MTEHPAELMAEDVRIVYLDVEDTDISNHNGGKRLRQKLAL